VARTRQPDTSAIKAMKRVTSTTPSIIPYCTLPIPVYEVGRGTVLIFAEAFSGTSSSSWFR
jgi:hypothetical protein